MTVEVIPGVRMTPWRWMVRFWHGGSHPAEDEVDLGNGRRLCLGCGKYGVSGSWTYQQIREREEKLEREREERLARRIAELLREEMAAF